MDSMNSLIDKLVSIGGREPRQVARTILILLLFGYAAGKFSKSVLEQGLKRTLLGIGWIVYKNVKGKSGIETEIKDIRERFEDGLINIHKECLNARKFHSLPKESMKKEELLSLLKKWSLYDNSYWNGTKKLASGSVYHGGKELMNLQCDAFKLFVVANPLHPETFPFIRKMESEIIAMVVSLFSGSPYNQCGLLTSGGTESILLAIRSYKNWGKEIKGITSPELIVAHTAHAAFWKACEMFNIKIRVLRVNEKKCVLDSNKLEKLINKNTIAIVGSAPQYAQGVMDPISLLSKLAIKYNIGLHVDCCLGSFMMPILKKLGYNIDPFDFTLPGVTTISCDTHKFGYSTKGTSVVMFRSKKLRRFAYFSYVDSSIGMYATPTIAGSRSGALIAATWSAMVHLGEQGYANDFENIMKATNKIHEAIEAMDTIEIIGDPKMSVLAFRHTKVALTTFQISDAMSNRGWTLNNCQDPVCTHICVTHATYLNADKFISDLKESIQDVEENPQNFQTTSGAMYGTIVDLPATAFKENILTQYLDVVLSPY